MRSLHENRRVYKIAIAAADAPSFLEACESARWVAVDSGERIMTEEGPDGDAVLLVEPEAVTTPRLAALLAQ